MSSRMSERPSRRPRPYLPEAARGSRLVLMLAGSQSALSVQPGPGTSHSRGHTVRVHVSTWWHARHDGQKGGPVAAMVLPECLAGLVAALPPALKTSWQPKKRLRQPLSLRCQDLGATIHYAWLEEG